MGHKSSKKRAAAAKKAASIILASTSNEPVLASTSYGSTSEVRQEQSKTESHASIVTECKLALDAREHGDPDKALRILKEAYLHHESCAALAHHIESSVRFGMATRAILMNVLKQIELWRAIESSDRAVSLSPNSLHFAVHYARVLYEAKVYEKAIQECKRAFSIDNPIDPVKDTIPGDREERLYKHHLTVEDRIEYVKEELQDLLEKSEIGILVMKRMKKEQETKMAKEKQRNEERRKEIMEKLALKEKMKQELGLRTEIEEEEGKLKDTFEHQQKQLAQQNDNPGAGWPSQRALEDGISKFDNRKLKGKMEEEGKLKDTLEYQQKQLANQNENPAAVKEQLNKEIRERMYWNKKLDMKIGQLKEEIQQRMDRIKQLDKEVEEDELGYLSF